jgi:heat shock protein HtpX
VRFLEPPRVREQLAKAEEQALSRTASDPYDSHPSLGERLAALRGLPDAPPAEADPLAVSLLTDPPGMEGELLAAAIGAGEKAGRLQPLPWEEVGPRVLVPQWSAFLGKCGPALRGLTPRSLPTIDWRELGLRVATHLRDDRAKREPERIAEHAIGVALGLALAQRGWTLLSLPGRAVELTKNAETLELGELRTRIGERPDDWMGFCERAGIASLHLAEVVPQPASPGDAG